jgi:hypothetical protein
MWHGISVVPPGLGSLVARVPGTEAPGYWRCLLQGRLGPAMQWFEDSGARRFKRLHGAFLHLTFAEENPKSLDLG